MKTRTRIAAALLLAATACAPAHAQSIAESAMRNALPPGTEVPQGADDESKSLLERAEIARAGGAEPYALWYISLSSFERSRLRDERQAERLKKIIADGVREGMKGSN